MAQVISGIENKKLNIYDKRCSNCSYHSENFKGCGSWEPGTLNEDQIMWEIYFGHLNGKYIFLINYSVATSNQTELGNMCCILTHAYTPIYIFINLAVYILKKHEFILILPIPIQHCDVDSSLPLFLTNNLFFQQWGAWLSLLTIYSLIQP